MRNLGSIGISARIGIAFALALPITFWALGSNMFEAIENYRRAYSFFGGFESAALDQARENPFLLRVHLY